MEQGELKRKDPNSPNGLLRPFSLLGVRTTQTLLDLVTVHLSANKLKSSLHSSERLKPLFRELFATSTAVTQALPFTNGFKHRTGVLVLNDLPHPFGSALHGDFVPGADFAELSGDGSHVFLRGGFGREQQSPAQSLESQTR